MKLSVAILKGIIIGVIITLIIPTLFGLSAQRAAGGYTSPFFEPWLYIGVSITTIPGLAYLGYYFSKKRTLSNKERWKISAIAVSAISILGNSFGAIIGNYILLGTLETTNTDAVFIWGIIYAVIFLPITIPLGKVILDILYYWINKISLIEFVATKKELQFF